MVRKDAGSAVWVEKLRWQSPNPWPTELLTAAPRRTLPNAFRFSDEMTGGLDVSRLQRSGSCGTFP